MNAARLLVAAAALCACIGVHADTPGNWHSADRSAFGDAPGCVPQLADDFIDNSAWTGRRLLPRDCRLLDERTPLFSWTEPPDRNPAQPFTLTLRAGDASLATRQTKLPRLLFDEPLAPGAYGWTVRYTARDGQVRTSAVRRFAVAPGARSGALPGGAAIALQVGQKARPRLAPAGTSLAAIGAAAKTGEYAVAYRMLIKTADESLAAAPARNPDSVSRSQHADDAAYNQALMGLRNASGKEGMALEALAFAWHFTGEDRYRDAALARLRNLAGWSPTGSTSENAQDQANRNVYVALATGADLLWSALTDADKQLIGESLRARLAPVLAQFATLDAAPYNSHLQTAIGHATTALALAVGLPGFPEARDWLAQAWECHITLNFVWGEEDGGMGNGTTYGWYGLLNLARSFAELRAITGVDFMARGYARRLGDFLMAFTPTPNRVPAPFGDGAETDYLFQAYSGDTFRLYALLSRQPQHAWYWRQNPANLTPTQYLSAIHLLAEAAAGTAVAAVAPTRTNWVFEDVGQAAFHSDPTSARRSSLFFRSSRFGAWNHAHADQNSFVFHSDGVPLLIGAGYYPYYASPHHANVGRTTRYKNALTFDGGIGQAEANIRPTAPTAAVFSMDARGALVASAANDHIAVATGDATLAYRGWDAANRRWLPLLTDAVRSVAYSRRERVLVVYDWATSESPRRWELNYHALDPFTVQDSGVVRVQHAKASACISHHGAEGDFTQKSTFDIPPESRDPPQHHGRFVASTRSTSFAIVTVIREDCRELPVDVKFNGSAATVTVGTESLRFDKRSAAVRD